MFSTPNAPFDRWRKYAFVNDLGYCWWLPEKGALVVQTSITHGDMRGSEALQDYLDKLLARESEVIAQFGGLAIVHDWRSVQTFDSGAAAHTVQRIRERPRNYLRSLALIITAENSFVQVSLQMASSIFAFKMSKKIVFTKDPRAALQSAGLSLSDGELV